MSDSQETHSTALRVVSNLILWGGIVGITVLAINSEHKLITIGVGIVVLLALLLVTGLLMTEDETPDDSKPEADRDDHESEVFSDWSSRAKQRKREGKTMIGGTVPSFPDPISSMAPKIREELVDFPTFSPDEIDYDDSIPEDELVDDTLVDDTTGHGVDLEEDLFAEGLWVAFELLDMDQSEWSMMPWGYEMLFAIEAILAAGGIPSRSRQLGRMRTWARQVSYKPKPELALELLGRIDSYMEAIRKDPSARDINPDALGEIEISAQRMRDRVALLL
ncbi:MAG: hypothetical protein ACSHX9_01505 [Luteolibacter sp.]